MVLGCEWLDEIEIAFGPSIMEFVLTYKGRLPSEQQVTNEERRRLQYEMRRHFHPQLILQWNSHAVLSRYVGEFKFPETAEGRPYGWKHHYIKDFDFIPLVVVGETIKLICELDVTILWRDEPGSILASGGDIDNRIKPLLDSLTIPQNNQIPPGKLPGDNEKPFLCLLQDDKLVTRLRISTKQLLTPAIPDEKHHYAEVSIEIKIDHGPRSVASVRI